MSDCCNKCGSITLFKGTNGDYVQVTPEPAGGNCPEGGLKVEIISGVDDTTVKDTEYICNGEQGLQGLQGDPGLPGQDGQDGAPGTDGADGADGASAYEIWLAQGNTGTEQDFLTSLEGAVQSVVAGTNVTVDNTDPANPIVSATAGGGTNAVYVDLSTFPGPSLNLAEGLYGIGSWDLRPNTTYILDRGSATVGGMNDIKISLPDAAGTWNGGFAPQIGDKITILGDNTTSLIYRVGNNGQSGPVVYVANLLSDATFVAYTNLYGDLGGNLSVSNNIVPTWWTQFTGIYYLNSADTSFTDFAWLGNNTLIAQPNSVADTKSINIEWTYTDDDEWTLTSHSWEVNSFIEGLFIDLV